MLDANSEKDYGSSASVRYNPSFTPLLSDSEEEDVASPHHPTYYFKNGIVVLLVDNRYFKVPRIRLEQNSPVLKQHFEDAGLTSSMGSTSGYYGLAGESDDRPVALEDVSSKDFARLLSFLYPLTNDYETFTDSWSHNRWMSILRLANKYEMVEIQAKAIRKLTHLNKFKTPVDKIKCGEEYGYVEWVRDGYKELIKRQESLSVAESERIGLKNTALCAAAREKYHDLVPRSGSAYYKNWHGYVNSSVPILEDWELEEILYDYFPHLQDTESYGNRVNPLGLNI